MDASPPFSPPRTVALVGLMGAGKSAIGKRLAQRLGLPFVDADEEIERAAGCSVAEFFERFGEAEFRAGERRVIARLLDGPPHVLSTGGGAYMDADTRALMRARATTVWLRADLDVLYDRVKRRGHRPLLKQGEPREILNRLMQQRYPIYAEADVTVESTAQPAERTTEEVIEALQAAGMEVDRAERGLDHGAWTPLRQMFPAADVPVVSVSVQPQLGPRHAYAVGRALAPLVAKGLFIIGSGNITHNLGDWRQAEMSGSGVPAYVTRFSDWIHEQLQQGQTERLLDYRRLNADGVRAHPTDEHLLPLFTAWGAAGAQAQAQPFFRGVSDHVIAMDGYRFQ